MTDQPRDPFAVATSLLDAVVAAYTSASVALPSRQVVLGGGLPAWDTEQVTVNLARVYQGLPGRQAGGPVPWQHGVFTGSFLVQLVRKATATLANSPRKQLPSQQQLEQDGERFMADMRLVAGALHTWRKAQRQGSVSVGDVTAPEQQGEMLGVSATVDVLLV